MSTAADPALWDAEAASFDREADHGLLDPATREAWRRLLLGALPPAPADVVDLGCGTGSLALLLTEAGYAVDPLDFSPEMVRRAARKLAGTDATPRLGDASDPGLGESTLDVVLCRHVVWALPDPDAALARWVTALRPGGRLVLIEGDWSTGAGLTARACRSLVERHAAEVEVARLSDPVLWGHPVEDERYLLTARA